MKKLLSVLPLFMVVASLLVITSCGDDDPIIIDPGSGDVNVGNGLYMAVEGEDPAGSAVLNPQQVAGLDFGAQDRSGFTANYLYLSAGDYNIVEVTDKEITATVGGTAEVVTDTGSSCGNNDYTVITATADGPAFNIASDGLYLVAHDELRSEIIIHEINSASIIGNATEGGWATETPLTGSVSEDATEFKIEGTILRNGEWKVRFNCRWDINRRTDPNGDITDPSTGYTMFTNFGGSVGDLAPGGSNLLQEEDGEYTITLNWGKQNGWLMTTERTGDAPVITFDPNDYKMAIIGDATAGSWDSDQNLFHNEDAGVHYWYGVVTFAMDGNYKYRANDDWNVALGGDPANPTTTGGDIPSPGAGSYYIVLSTADEGATWTSSVTEGGWGLIGDGSPQGNWDADIDMTADGFSNGITTYSYTGDFVGGIWKFRAGDDWAHNLGGDLSGLTTGGSDLNTSAGNYTVTLSFNGENYSATVQ